jgi:phytoene dehydrogenase-like protein
MNSSTKHVAVVGAGISGITAAAHLKKEGLEVTVFERSSAAGGIWYIIMRPRSGGQTLIQMKAL